MTPRRPRKPSLENHLRDLLYALCVEWGFCIPPVDQDRIAKSRQLSAEEFTAAVLHAEGFAPEYERQWFRRIKRRFTDRFGEQVSAESYEASNAAWAPYARPAVSPR